MHRLILVALGAGAFALTAADAQAQDTMRLGHTFSVPGPSHAGTMTGGVNTLAYHGGATTDLTHYGRGYYGGYRGGYRGGYGFSYYGPRVSFSYGGYGAYRPYGYYGGYRSSYYGGGYYGGGYYGYRPYYSSYYSPYYYSYPVRSYYYYPCSDSTVMPQAVVLGSSNYQVSPPVVQSVPVDQPSGPQTYPYDGGPSVAPPPMPGADPTPIFQQKRPTVPLEGKIVSLPRAAPGSVYSYTAYGETPAGVRSTPSVPVYVSVPVPATTTKTAFKAYGEK